MSSNLLPLSNALQQRLEANTRLKDFLREAEALSQADPGSGFAACSGLLETLCTNGAFTGLVNYELDRLLRDPNYALEASSDVDMLVLRSRSFNLMLKIIPPSARTGRLIGQASDLILAPLTVSGVTITRYREPLESPHESAEGARGLLVCQGDETVPFGYSSYFKAGEDAFTIQSDVSSPALVACLSATATLTTRWEYDIATLTRVRVVAADHSVSRLQLLASVLAEMNDSRAIPALEGLMAHPAHYVRWAALQAIFCLDRDHGISLLKTAVTDAHEQVRKAAVRSLAKLNEAALCSAPKGQQ